MPSYNCDVLILGGGCAGLATAFFYSQTQGKQTIDIIEKREFYDDDRSWCFWLSMAQFPHKDIIFHQWPTWTLSKGSTVVEHTNPGTPYAIIKSKDYYNKVLAAIEDDSRQRLHSNTTVFAIKKEKKCFVVDTSSGQFIARHVIDTRPNPSVLRKKAPLHQIFYGVEIKTKQPVFDPTSAHLMKNLVATDIYCQFDYILPFSPYHALLEVTRFSSMYHGPEQLMQECLKLTHQYTTEFDTLRVEAAVLPMGIAKGTQDSNSCHVFAQHQGSLRASSGYGFLRIQQRAWHHAQQIGMNKALKEPVLDLAIDRWMDLCFCRVLLRQMPLSPEIFILLARRLNPSQFAHFMNGTLGWSLRWKVIRAMPSWPFIKAVL